MIFFVFSPRTWLLRFKDGRDTREEAAAKFIEYAEMVREFPGLIDLRGLAEELHDEELYDRALFFLGRFHPRGIYGSRKLGMLQSDVVIFRNDMPFRHSFDVNMTYDESEPDHPYRFAFHIGIMAKSAPE